MVFRHLLLLAGLVFTDPGWTLPVDHETNTHVLPAKYIITLKTDLNENAVKSHFNWVGEIHARSLSHQATDTIGVNKVFSADRFNAYSGTFDDDTLVEIQSDDRVAFVEPNEVFSLSTLTTQTDAGWDLGAVSHRTPNHTNFIYDTTAGQGTWAYVIDTGINTAHVEFEGRAYWGYNAYTSAPAVDENGHGTHVSGLIGSRAFGVAKKTKMIAVKAFNATGQSTTEIILDAMTWTVNNITATPGRAAISVINMSFGGPYTEAFNQIVEASYQKGILSVIASGNNAAPAANYSPASAPNGLTVGATNIVNAQNWYSNYGASVDMLAPGAQMISAWIGSNTATHMTEGTSQAAPHVAGVALYLKALYSGLDSPAAVRTKIMDIATKGVITGLDSATPNVLIYNGNGAV